MRGCFLAGRIALTDVEPWRQHPAYGGHIFAPPGVPPPKTFRQAYYFEDKDGKEEVTALCQRYLDFLDKMQRLLRRQSAGIAAMIGTCTKF